MTPERWAQLQELLDQALVRSRVARADYLDQECTDPELRRELDSLLLAAESDATLLANSPGLALGGAAMDSSWQAGDRRVPDQLGPYRLLEPLGEGGMGTVYRAERTDAVYDKQVAIKLLQAPALSGDMLERFSRERRLLAELDHPNIARLLDGGAEDGLPYLVMELVEGVPIDQYCRQHDLAIAERLRLFSKVCDGVQFAHQNLIVHRDLKPANILVTENGEPKLLDFGIAKLLSAESAIDPVLATAAGLTPMTPAYASPEQILNETITTATDVYSLGVLLYELLTGVRPYRLTEVSTRELIRVVCEQDPPAPSTAVKDASEGQLSMPERRLVRLLQGDLDIIALKALRKEVSDRYASAEQFAADIGRYLDGLPVLANRAGIAYKAAKFVRRNRWPVGLSAAALTLLVGLTVTLAWQRIEVQAQRDRAETAKGFLVDLFENSDPILRTGGELPASEILDRGAERIRTERGMAADVRADLLTTVGGAFLGLGEFGKAEELLSDGLEIRQRLHSRDHLDLATSLAAVGQAEANLGNFVRAESLTARSAAMGARLGDRMPRSEQVKNLTFHAHTLELLGKLNEAREQFGRVLGLAREGGDARALASSLHYSGRLARRLADYGEARQMLEESAEIYEQLKGPEHGITLLAQTSLGELLRDIGELSEAEELLTQVVARMRLTLGDDHARLSEALSVLSHTYRDLGDLAAARDAGEEALAIVRREFSPPHPQIADRVTGLAFLYSRLGLLKEADELAAEGLAMRQAQFGELLHPQLGDSWDCIGVVALKRGAFVRASQAFERALEIFSHAFGSKHPRVGLVLSNLGLAETRQAEFGAAKESLDQAIEVLTVADPTSYELAAALTNRGYLLETELAFAEAARDYREALDIATRVLGPGHVEIGSTLDALARAELGLGQHEQALQHAQRAQEILSSLAFEDHRRAWADFSLARSLELNGQVKAAEDILTRRASGLDLADPANHWLARKLSEFYQRQGDVDREERYQQFLPIEDRG